MITTDDLQSIMGGTAVDDSGDKIGKVGQVYLDDNTGDPAWATVNTGLLGKSESFIPLAMATVDGDSLRVPYSKQMIKDAPRLDVDRHLEVSQEEELYRYYGLDYEGGGGQEGTPATTGAPGHDVAGGEVTPVTPDVTNREQDADRETAGDPEKGAGAGTGDDGEQGTGARTHRRGEEPVGDRGPDEDKDEDKAGSQGGGEPGRRNGRGPRLRRHIITEQQTITVPVQREVVELEDEPPAEDERPGG